MAEVSTILLAAGLSRRMGARNKLLLDVGGVPMIRHMVNTYAAATQGPITVVTGHDAPRVTEALTGSDAQIVYNPGYESGQVTSVERGLKAAPEAEVLLMGLGDQPLLTANDISALLRAHRAADTARISIPKESAAEASTRGNPIVIPAALRARLLADPRAPGCKKFTRENPEHVQVHILPQPGFYTDIDTPEAYAALLSTEAKV